LSEAAAVILTQARSPFPRALIERLPKLKLISQTGRSTGHIDIDACTEHGVVVSAAGKATAHPTAELTWGLILGALRYIPYEVQRLREGHWQSTVGVCVKGKTLGIYAYGRIGSLVANAGRAFGARVVCWGREASLARARAAGFEVAQTRSVFFAESDILSLHLPLNSETRGIVTAGDLARMKPTALIVNTSRAGIIAEGALVEALKAGRPGFAAVDVFEDEPVIGAAHPLLKMEGLQAFLWVTWHCHLDSNLCEKRKFFIGLGYSSRQGAKNAKFGNLFSFFAAPSTWLRTCFAGDNPNLGCRCPR
jgi:D-3-phosphoglycerate dehydrogenase